MKQKNYAIGFLLLLLAYSFGLIAHGKDLVTSKKIAICRITTLLGFIANQSFVKQPEIVTCNTLIVKAVVYVNNNDS